MKFENYLKQQLNEASDKSTKTYIPSEKRIKEVSVRVHEFLSLYSLYNGGKDSIAKIIKSDMKILPFNSAAANLFTTQKLDPKLLGPLSASIDNLHVTADVSFDDENLEIRLRYSWQFVSRGSNGDDVRYIYSNGKWQGY